MNVLAIGAHPDDIEIYCAGTIARHVASGDNVFFLVLTDGSKGGKKSVRYAEAKKSAELLKVKKLFLAGFKDTALSYEPKLAQKIREVVEKTRPVRVYTHSLTDYHLDHFAAARASLAACNRVNEILQYEGSVSSGFCPDYFVDVKDFIGLKEKVIRLFESQNKKSFSDLDYVWAFSRNAGLQANFRLKYAEAFKVFKMIKPKNSPF